MGYDWLKLYYEMSMKIFVRFVDLNFVQCFSDSVWFHKSLAKKNKKINWGKLQF